jgi:hypothetical protein
MSKIAAAIGGLRPVNLLSRKMQKILSEVLSKRSNKQI